MVRSDVQGSTGLGERHDPELLRQVLARYYDAARSACTYHGGMIEQIQGDAVVAIFDGHEDDALRAVRAATELRDRMTRLNEEFERAALRLPIRTAVEYGEVVAGAGGPGQLTGEVMNIVAHLEKVAGPGEIVLGESAHRLVREAVDVEEIGPLTLKDRQQPVHAYRLLVLRPGVGGRVHLAVPMVGRRLELALLTSAFGRSAEDRICQLMTIFGPAGVGKSRLVEELLALAQDRATILRGRCPSYGGVAYEAMIQVVAEAARLDLADPDTARRRLEALVAGLDGAERIVERIGQVLGLRTGGGPPEDTHWALRRLLEVLARDRPLIVVLEDLHWADPALLDLVEDIAESSRDAPLLVLCATRLELLDKRARWAGGKVNAVSIQLAPLAAEEAKLLVSHLLGDMATAPGVREYIVDRSGGNPLFVQGLVAMLREKGLLRVDEGRWRTEVEWLEAPRDIQALVNARLTDLGADERRVVERAAIVGRQFTQEAILALSPDAERPELAANLRTLVRKGLIVPDPDSGVASRRDTGYEFAHALIQEVAYHAIAKKTRADLHERFATWLEQTSGGDVAQVEEVVGHHLKQAHGCLVALRAYDERTARLARRAGEALAAAGHRAAARRDIPEYAVSLLRQADSILKDNDEARRDVLLDLGDALQDSISIQHALEAYGRAIELAHAAGDTRRATHGFLGVLAVKGFLGKDEGIRGEDPRVENARTLFKEQHDLPGLAKAWQAKAYSYWTAGRLRSAERACRLAIGCARRADDERLEVAAVSSRCFIMFWGPTPLDEVQREVEVALGWARRRGIRRLEVDALHILARISGMQGRFAAARALLQEAATGKKAEARELLVLVGKYLSTALVELMADEPAAAELVLRRSYQELKDLGGTGQLDPVIILLARALAMQGRDEEAMERTRECEESAPDSHRDAQIKWRAIRALLLARRGELAAAERLAAEAVGLTVGWEQEDSTAEVEADYAHVLRLAGRNEEARQMAQQAVARYRRKGNLVGARRAAALLGPGPVG